jgi:hypothetical protein
VNSGLMGKLQSSPVLAAGLAGPSRISSRAMVPQYTFLISVQRTPKPSRPKSPPREELHRRTPVMLEIRPKWQPYSRRYSSAIRFIFS